VIFPFRVSLRYARSLCASVFGLTLAITVVGCGEEGATPDCPPLPRYDVRTDTNDAGVLTTEARARFDALKGSPCVTPPGDASTVETGAN